MFVYYGLHPSPLTICVVDLKSEDDEGSPFLPELLVTGIRWCFNRHRSFFEDDEKDSPQTNTAHWSIIIIVIDWYKRISLPDYEYCQQETKFC